MGELVDINAFKNAVPAKAFAGDDVNANRLSDGIGGGYGVIGYKGGKQWTLRYRGETHVLLDHTNQPARSLEDIVIVGSAPSKSKSYYPAYVEGSAERPICASMDGLRPDPEYQPPQAQACAICVRNAFKIMENGRKGKECADYKRLAVILSPAMTMRTFGEPMLEPVFLRVPAASLQALSRMGDDMAGRGFAFYMHYTRVEFDLSQAYPKMVFVATRPLPDEDAGFIQEARALPITQRIVEGGVSGDMRVVGQNMENPPPPPPISFSAARTQLQQVQHQPQQEVLPPLRTVTAPVTPAPAAPMGFAAAKAAMTSGDPVGPPAPQMDIVANDLGDPSESDAEMDARIAQAMSRVGLAPTQ